MLTNWQTSFVGILILAASIAKWWGDKNVNLTDFDTIVKLLAAIGFIAAKDGNK